MGEPDGSVQILGLDLERYLTTRLGATAVHVRTVERSYPGMSRETYFVAADVKDSRGQIDLRRVVVRRDAPGGPVVPTELRQEWDVYRLLSTTALPVGKALWWEDGVPWATKASPFFVRDLVEGSSQVPGIHDPDPRFEPLRRACAERHAEALAAVHQLDWAGVGFGDVLPAPRDGGECASLDFELWRRRWDVVKLGDDPLMTAAAEWFRRHLPRDSPAISLLKGNNGLGEEVWRDGRIVALCDWELAGIGDPTQDWAWAEGTGMDRLSGDGLMIGHYSHLTGWDIPAANLEYYRAWRLYKIVCNLTYGLRAAQSPGGSRPALFAMAFGALPPIRAQLARAIQPATARRGPPPRPTGMPQSSTLPLTPTAHIADAVVEVLEEEIASTPNRVRSSKLTSAVMLVRVLAAQAEDRGTTLSADIADIEAFLQDRGPRTPLAKVDGQAPPASVESGESLLSDIFAQHARLVRRFDAVLRDAIAEQSGPEPHVDALFADCLALLERQAERFRRVTATVEGSAPF